MARRNERGLDLSFKRYGKGRSDGRWFKIVNGKPIYFGTGRGVSDRRSYADACGRFKLWQAGQIRPAVRPGAPEPTGEPTTPSIKPTPESVEQDRLRWDALAAVQTNSTWQAYQLRHGFGPIGKGNTPLGKLIDNFVEDQRRRNKRRQYIEAQRALGTKVQE